MKTVAANHAHLMQSKCNRCNRKATNLIVSDKDNEGKKIPRETADWEVVCRWCYNKQNPPAIPTRGPSRLARLFKIS